MKTSNIHLDLKYENRNRIFNKIRESGNISSSALSYALTLSRPTVRQNLTELTELGLIYESGAVGHTGGRKAKTYAIVSGSKIAVGIDLTRNHITVVLVNLYGNIIYSKRIRCSFSLEDAYLKNLGNLIEEALLEQNIDKTTVVGVGIAVPGLITEDHKKIFYGKILNFTDVTVSKIGKYIPYPCRLYNDADAGGYAEVSRRHELSDAFYISLSNNIGGSILIDHKVYSGEGPRSGEIGHMTIIPEGRECYCGQRGCFETYCNAALLSDPFDGDLSEFFRLLKEGDTTCASVWENYMYYLSIAVNNIRVLFDCKVILGGYVGPYLEDYLEELKDMAAKRNTFENNAEYLSVCQVKKEALALGSALPFIHEFWKAL